MNIFNSIQTQILNSDINCKKLCIEFPEAIVLCLHLHFDQILIDLCSA